MSHNWLHTSDCEALHEVGTAACLTSTCSKHKEGSWWQHTSVIWWLLSDVTSFGAVMAMVTYRMLSAVMH